MPAGIDQWRIARGKERDARLYSRYRNSRADHLLQRPAAVHPDPDVQIELGVRIVRIDQSRNEDDVAHIVHGWRRDPAEIPRSHALPGGGVASSHDEFQTSPDLPPDPNVVQTTGHATSP